VVQQFGPLILTGRACIADREPNRSDAAVGQGMSHFRLSASEMTVTHARCYTLLTPSHTFLAVGSAHLALQSLSKTSGVSTVRPRPCNRPAAGRLFSGGTLKKPQPQTAPGLHHSRRQVSEKDFQMGEIASEEAPFPLTDVDRWVLSQTDEEYTYHTWDELRQLIRTTNSLFATKYCVGLGTNTR
jgi:hypothetical protein